MPARTQLLPLVMFLILSGLIVCVHPATAFTANSLAITIEKNGDATAVFSYSLEGVIENAIPQSMLEEELKRGLSTSSEPPEIVAFDRSGATLFLRKFAQVSTVESGTEYVTASMDFKKAEIALKNSALSYIITADFSPQTSKMTFPDGFSHEFTNTSTLPSLSHTVANPAGAGSGAQKSRSGTIVVTSSPDRAHVYIDSQYAGETPGTFTDLLPGMYTVRVEREDCMPAAYNVTVEAGVTTTLSVALPYLTPVPDTGSTLSTGLPGFEAVLCCMAFAWIAALQGMRF